MPEINGSELILAELKKLDEKWVAEKAERLTADEARKKEIDAKLAAIETRQGELAAAQKKSAQFALPGMEYGAKGEADKPTWTRLLQLVAEPERRKNTKVYGPELEMIAEVQKTAINAGTGASGGFLVPTTMRAGIVPELRERSIARQLGATVISNLSPGSHQWARSKGGITAVHINTEGEESISESVPTFDQITTQPRTAACIIPMTRGMMTQSAEAIESWVRGEIAKIIALFEDKQFFVGLGGSAPRGIFNHPSVDTFAFTETTIKEVWGSLIDAVLDVRNAQATDLDGLGWATEPAARFWLARILDLQGRPLFDSLMNSDLSKTGIPRQVMSYPLFDSAQLDSGDAANRNFMFGPWSSGTLAEWSPLELALNTESDTNFLKARGSIRGLFDYDAAFFQPQAFTKATGFNSGAAVPTTL